MLVHSENTLVIY